MIKHPVSSKAAQDFIDNVYQDRGMMKWQGFMLSDHKAAMNKQDNSEPTQLEQQTRDYILSMLKKSLDKKVSIVLQFNFFENGFPCETIGVVNSISEEAITLKRDNEVYEIDTIRNIRID